MADSPPQALGSERVSPLLLVSIGRSQFSLIIIKPKHMPLF